MNICAGFNQGRVLIEEMQSFQNYYKYTVDCHGKNWHSRLSQVMKQEFNCQEGKAVPLLR